MENKNEFIRPNNNSGADGSLPNKQKLALFGLAVFAIGVLFLWGMEFKNNIFNPSGFEIANNKTGAVSGEQCLDGNCQETEEDEGSKNSDTDKDGLSDWNELNEYGTSPYLADSDSDGIEDGTEVKSGTNPNCAQGSDCSFSDSLMDESLSASSSPQLPADAEDIIRSNAAILRQVLLESGTLDEKTLNQISDEELLALYQLAAEEAASSTE